jgi:hypothetical protein
MQDGMMEHRKPLRRICIGMSLDRFGSGLRPCLRRWREVRCRQALSSCFSYARLLRSDALLYENMGRFTGRSTT